MKFRMVGLPGSYKLTPDLGFYQWCCKKPLERVEQADKGSLSYSMKTVLCKEVEETRNTQEDLGECSAMEGDGCRQTSYLASRKGRQSAYLASVKLLI